MTVAVFSADCLTFFPDQSPAHNPQAFARAALRLPGSHLSAVKRTTTLKSAGNLEGEEEPEASYRLRTPPRYSPLPLKSVYLCPSSEIAASHACLKVKNEMDRILVAYHVRLAYCGAVRYGAVLGDTSPRTTACRAERRVAFTSF